MEHLDKLREAAQLILTFTELHGAARPDAALTVGELLDEFLTAKARTGRSVRYLRQMRTAINRVLREQRGRAVATVTTRELEAALAARKVSPRTVKSYLSDVRTLLGFAVRRGYLARNAAAPIDAPRCPPKPPALHTPAEVRRILATARASHPAFCRTLAVRYFSGLRSAEAFRLSEAEIKGNYIEVTRRRRARRGDGGWWKSRPICARGWPWAGSCTRGARRGWRRAWPSSRAWRGRGTCRAIRFAPTISPISATWGARRWRRGIPSRCCSRTTGKL